MDDRTEAIDILTRMSTNHFYGHREQEAFKLAVEALSAERRGRWEAIDRDCRGYAITYECSSCKQLITLPYPMKWMDYDYCPNCGSFNGEGGENEEL